MMHSLRKARSLARSLPVKRKCYCRSAASVPPRRTRRRSRSPHLLALGNVHDENKADTEIGWLRRGARPVRANQSGLKKIGVNRFDNLIDNLDKITQGWNDRLSVNTLRFIERYAKAEMRIGIEVFPKKDRSKKFVAIFQRKGRERSR